ncbi:MAG TPA: NAD(P)H-hydrate dehydratase [Roseiarcus sp.]|nr:NAD(P)H-hydrate dehydratase [Roseiarcus sp.]
MLKLADCPELLTPEEMGRADRFAIAAGVPGLVLMERAGLAVARAAARAARARGRIVVLCGPGGNGGDGFVAARYLSAWGYPTTVYLLGDAHRLRGDSAEMAARWTGTIAPAEGFAAEGADLVIDALYGAGLSRDIDGLAARCVGAINAFVAAGGKALAVDAPSGLDGATGQVRGIAVTATATVTFFRLKPGHLLSSGGGQTGPLAFADIGIPAAALDEIAPQAFANQPRLWRAALPRLGADAHKYARGAALVLSGAAAYTGAARLAARAALRAGAGLATIASPAEAVAINAAHETAVMVAPFEGEAGFAELLADPRRNAILIGPGAGVGEATRAYARAALTAPGGPRVVLDADALTSFAGDAATLAALVSGRRRPAVITPHAGEFARLFRGRDDILGAVGKLAQARAAARALGAVVILKGADTVVAAPDGRASIGCDLPPTLATAGSGDTLAGFVCGLLAQGTPAFEAASAAVWLHGACARALGPGLIAEDLADALPGVFSSGELIAHA